MSEHHPVSAPAPARDHPWFEVRCWWEPPVPADGIAGTDGTAETGAEPHWTVVAYCDDRTSANAVADALLQQPWHYYRRAEVWGPARSHEESGDELVLHDQLEAPALPPATVGGHWRARFRVVLAARDGEEHRTYGAWIGAGSEAEALELLRTRLEEEGGGWEDLRSWELDELVNAARDQPEVIAMWREDL